MARLWAADGPFSPPPFQHFCQGMRLPLFVVFEGPDGSGTSTQCQIRCDRLRAEGHEIVQTREPGGTEAGERIRSLVLDPELEALDDVAELLLYAASRRQHLQELIEPALASGKPVISDRYAASSFAYQGAGRGLGRELVSVVNEVATNGREPDASLFLDVPLQQARRRRGHRGEDGDRIEAAGDVLQERVRLAYRRLAEREPERCILFDGSPGALEVAASIERCLEARFPSFPYR